MNEETLLEEGDIEEEPEIIRAKWTMDGARTLSEAAKSLREYADYLDQLERDGWQLTSTVDDDYGYIRQEPKS